MKEFLATFLEQIHIQTTSLEVQEIDDDISIRIETPDSSLLIGLHGKNREALEHLFGRIAEKKYGKFMHVHLEINDYLKQKEEKLLQFLEKKVSDVLSTGRSYSIKNLSAYERKKAHNYIADKKIEGLSTKSEGEGENRVLIVQYSGLPKGVNQNVFRNQISTIKNDLPEDGVGI